MSVKMTKILIEINNQIMRIRRTSTRISIRVVKQAVKITNKEMKRIRQSSTSVGGRDVKRASKMTKILKKAKEN